MFLNVYVLNVVRESYEELKVLRGGPMESGHVVRRVVADGGRSITARKNV